VKYSAFASWVCSQSAFRLPVAPKNSNRFRAVQNRRVLSPPDSPEYRKYAPDRSFAVLNLAIDVTPDFTNRTIAATTTIKFKPIVTPLAELPWTQWTAGFGGEIERRDSRLSGHG
jgi:hypothetical protein